MNKVTSSGNKALLMNIYREMISASESIKDYNFRSYFVRRTNEVFNSLFILHCHHVLVN